MIGLGFLVNRSDPGLLFPLCTRLQNLPLSRDFALLPPLLSLLEQHLLVILQLRLVVPLFDLHLELQL